MTQPARFKQADATRALRAAVKAGLRPSECVIDSSGSIRLVFSDGTLVAGANPLDRILRQ